MLDYDPFSHRLNNHIPTPPPYNGLDKGPYIIPTVYLVFTVLFMVLFFNTKANSFDTLIREVHDDIPRGRSIELAEEIRKNAILYDVPSSLVVSIIWKETGFRNIQSQIRMGDGYERSCGYGQIHLKTAESMLGREVTCDWLIYNWRTNIKLTVKYLSLMIHLTGHKAGGIGRYNGRNNLGYVYDVLSKRRKVMGYVNQP